MPNDSTKLTTLSYSPSNAVLDRINRQILTELLGNPRLPMSALARRVGMSSPAVTERVRRLEESGVIRGYRLDLDPAALGLPLAAYIRVRPNPGQLARVADLARALPEVTECHRITGDDCLIVKVHLPAMDQLDRVLDQLLMFGTTTTSIVQSTPVPLRALPLPES